MIEIKQDFYVSVQDLKVPHLFVKVCDDVRDNPERQYAIARRQSEPAGAVLVSRSFLNEKIAGLTAAVPLLSFLKLNAPAASVRFEEVYKIATGESNFPFTEITTELERRIDYSGFERKVVDQSALRSPLVTEQLIVTGGIVTTANAISDIASISGSNMGEPLVVVTADAVTGQIEFSQDGNPVPDGTEITVSYAALSFVGYDIELSGETPVSIISQEALDYLLNNQ